METKAEDIRKATEWFLTEGYKTYLENKKKLLEKAGLEVKTFCTNPFKKTIDVKELDLIKGHYKDDEFVIGLIVDDKVVSECSFGTYQKVGVKESDEEILDCNYLFWAERPRVALDMTTLETEINESSSKGMTKNYFFATDFNKKNDDLYIGRGADGKMMIEINRKNRSLYNLYKFIRENLNKSYNRFKRKKA